MSVLGIRSRLKSGLKKVLGMEEDAAGAASAPVTAAPPTVTPVVPPVAPVSEPEVPEAAAEPVAAAAEPAAATAPAAPGPAITMEAVQELLDDMVRPALQGDGGDITLIKVEDDIIYVRLVGACSTCPSSIMTMKMGVEQLLKEEFPTLKDVVQVDA